MTEAVHLKGHWETGDIERLARLTGGSFTFTSGSVDEGNPCSILIGGVVRLEEIDNCPSLRTIIVPYAGIPEVTAKSLGERPGIEIRSIHHNAVSASEMAVTLMLAAAKLIIPGDNALRKGDWTPRYRPEGLLIEDSRILVLGWGAIGSRVGRICSAMGASVKGVRRTPGPGFYTTGDLPELLPETDILVVCVPLDDSTRGIIGDRELKFLPPGAVVVNIARGRVIDEAALFVLL
mgnify:CR=1 FL=1